MTNEQERAIKQLYNAIHAIEDAMGTIIDVADYYHELDMLRAIRRNIHAIKNKIEGS